MSAHRPDGLDRVAVERLLDGDLADPQAGPDALVRLLAAARVNARPGELAGEQAAMDAFRAARLSPVPQSRRRSMLESALAKLLTLKVAGAAAVAALATGGVALAAANGVLPNPLTEDVKVQPSPHVTESKSAAEHGKASPSPNLAGLCKAYQAGVADNPGKALENPAFGALIEAAGGDREKVAGYCGDLLAADTHGKKPTAAPTVRPSERPGGKPENLPATTPGKPAGGAHPTGAPTTHPAP